MEFIAGIIIGLLLDTFIVILFIYFAKSITKKEKKIRYKYEERSLEDTLHNNKGIIIEPISEADEVREEIIKNNDKKGIDTYINDLR